MSDEQSELQTSYSPPHLIQASTAEIETPSYEAPPFYEALEGVARRPILSERETARNDLDSILAIGPYTGDAVRIMASIKEFGVRTILVDGLFERVKCDLRSMDHIDQEELRAGDEKRLEYSAIELQKRYVDLLWEMRTLAARTEAHLLDFIDVVLPGVVDYTASSTDRRSEIGTFINRSRPTFRYLDAANPAQAFGTVEGDIRAFLGEAKTISDRFLEKAQNANVELKAVNVDLQARSHSYQESLTKTPLKIGLTLGMTAFGAAVALPMPSASACIAAAGVGFAILQTVKIVWDIKNLLDVTDKRKSLVVPNKLAQVVSQLEGINARVVDESSKIPNLSDLSQTFVRLWDITRDDAQLVAERNLDDIVHDEDLLLRIENITVTYKAYASALAEFAVMINRAGVFVGRR